MLYDCFRYSIKIEYLIFVIMLDTTSNSVLRFNTKSWIKVHYQSGNAENRYKSSKHIRFKTAMLQSGLCDYSDAYIFVKEKITVTGANDATYDNKLAFKNNVSFICCVSKNSNKLIDNAVDLDIVMSMYN